MSKLLVVIPLYNKELTIVRSVESVLNQGFKEFDLLIVNDGSTDQSISVIEKITDSRITILNQENKGVSAARNAGLKYAQDNHFDIIAFLDGDDYWYENHLETIVHLLNTNPTAGVAATNYQIKNSNSSIIETRFSNLESHSAGIIEDFFEKNYLNSILGSSSFALNLKVLKPIEFYNETYTHGEDTDFFIRLGINYPVAFSIQKTTVIDRTASNRSDHIPMNDRVIFDLDIYETTEIKGLKKYLDINRFSIALSYRMEGNIKEALYYQQKIDCNNLSLKQNKLLEMSRIKLKALYKTKQFLEVIGLDLRTG